LRAGADAVFDPKADGLAEEVMRLTGGLGLDVAVDLVGHPTVREQALALLGPHGVLSLVGLSPAAITISEPVRFSYMQQQMRGHYGYEPGDLLEIVHLVRWHRLDFSASVSGVLPLADAAEGVRRLAAKEGNPIRLILQP
jgi:threonine dehydrogenase-like Zn-dependent dehydrogenase